MSPSHTNLQNHGLDSDGAAALALGALGWILSDSGRTDRLIGLTGLTPEGLRGGLGDSAILAAVLGFLEAHEPDLVACAESIGVDPATLIAARTLLDA
jgi:hypothetical protein